MSSTSWCARRRLAAGALGLQLLLTAARAGATNTGKVDQLFAPWPRLAADHHPRGRSPHCPGNSRGQVPHDTTVRDQLLRASLRTARRVCPSTLRSRHEPALPRHQRPEAEPAGPRALQRTQAIIGATNYASSLASNCTTDAWRCACAQAGGSTCCPQVRTASIPRWEE